MHTGKETLMDRLPPHAIDAERGILGCMMLDPMRCIPDFLRRVIAGPGAFYDIRHQVIGSTLVTMYDSGASIDLITVQQRLRDEEQIAAIGGLPYLIEITESVPSAANLPHYVEQVLEKLKLRKLLDACATITSEIWTRTEEIDAFVDAAEAKVHSVRDTTTGRNDLFGGRELANLAVEQLEDAREGMSGLPSGWVDLDRYLQGFRGGELIVVGARTSTGKTAWLLNVARFLAFERQIPVGIYTLENSPKSVATRIVCADARLNARHVADWTPDDWDSANESTARMAMAPIFLDGASGLTIRDIRAGVRRMVRENGIKAVFIDYLQLVAGVGKKSSDNRQSEVSEVSRGLKALAKEVDIPVIVASQLNRESEKNAGLRPKLSDLRESGSIEQDASVVLMLYRPTTDATVLEDEDIKGTCKVKMLLAKQRDGISGIDINLAFNKLHQRMDIWPKVESNDVMHTVPQPALPYSDVG